MMIQDFYIKNMVCDRCIKVLRSEIESHKIDLMDIELGRVELDVKDEQEVAVFKDILNENGFSLIDSIEVQTAERVKIILIRMMENLPLQLDGKLSSHLSDLIGMDYSKLSRMFSATEGVTIEKYFIKLRIEKVKELVQANEQNFTQMSQLLNYSNLNHLSRQFKTETGMSLTEYKRQSQNLRNSLDQI